MKNIALKVLLLSSIVQPVLAENYNNVRCIQNISKVNCSSRGYWEGANETMCFASVRFQPVDNKFEIKTIGGLGYAQTQTGLLTLLTLGLSDVVINQAKALSASHEARTDLDQKLEEVKLIPFCHGATDLSGFDTNQDDLYR